MESKLCLAIPL